jgi:hypothetical protein
MATIVPANKDAQQSIIAAVLKSLESKEIVLNVRGPFMTAVLLHDGTYKNKVIDPAVELLFKGMRPGQRSAFVFEFEPVAFSEFKRVEFDENKIFQAIPSFEKTLTDALGVYDDDSTWMKAKKVFLKEEQQRREAERELAEIEELERNAEDELWGSF